MCLQCLGGAHNRNVEGLTKQGKASKTNVPGNSL